MSNSSSGGAQGERKVRMKLNLPPKLEEKLVWVSVISFCKIFIAMKLNLPPKLMEKLVWVPVISFCKIFIAGYLLDALL
jgi:hypothetical protein